MMKTNNKTNIEKPEEMISEDLITDLYSSLMPVRKGTYFVGYVSYYSYITEVSKGRINGNSRNNTNEDFRIHAEQESLRDLIETNKTFGLSAVKETYDYQNLTLNNDCYLLYLKSQDSVIGAGIRFTHETVQMNEQMLSSILYCISRQINDKVLEEAVKNYIIQIHGMNVWTCITNSLRSDDLKGGPL